MIYSFLLLSEWKTFPMSIQFIIIIIVMYTASNVLRNLFYNNYYIIRHDSISSITEFMSISIVSRDVVVRVVVIRTKEY